MDRHVIASEAKRAKPLTVHFGILFPGRPRFWGMVEASSFGDQSDPKKIIQNRIWDQKLCKI